jgi:hypothetical protein
MAAKPRKSRPDATEKAADVLRGEVERLQRAVVEAEQHAEGIADARLEAVRAELDKAEQDRAAAVAIAEEAVRAAEQAPQGEAEREQASERALELQADLEVARADLTMARAAIDQALVTARAAQQDAERLHTAEAARKGRGRWARLRQAWRGE